MAYSNYRKYIEPNIQDVINKFSLACAIITLFLIGGLGYFRPHIVNRVSLRFQGIISLVDIIRHLVYANKVLPKGSLCAFVGFLGFLIDHIYLFTNMIITINIQLLYFHNIHPQRGIELLLITVAVMTAVVIDIVPFAFDFYGLNLLKVCVMKNKSPKRKLFKIILIYVVRSSVMVYCLVVFSSVFMFLKLRKNYLESKIPNKTIILFGERINARDFIQKLYYRMALYPVSTFICFFPSTAANVYYDIHHSFPGWIYTAMRLGLRISGTLNLIALLFDPHFQIAIKNIRKKGLYSTHVDGNELDIGIDLKTIIDLKVEEECPIEFPGQKNLEFEEYIKFI